MPRLPLFFLLILPTLVHSAESTSVEGRVSAVTVYQGQASSRGRLNSPKPRG